MEFYESRSKASEIWKEMDEKAQKPYKDKYKEELKLYEMQKAEREKKGFFTMPDGTKSTDLKNLYKVKAFKKCSDEDEAVLMPKKVTGAYGYFFKY